MSHFETALRAQSTGDMAQQEYVRASSEEVWLARFAPIAAAGESHPSGGWQSRLV